MLTRYSEPWLFLLNPDPGPGGPTPTPAPAPAPAPAPTPAPQPAPHPTPAPTPAPGGQVFTAEYVEALRGESASYRTQLRTAQAAARAALGLADGAELPQDLGAALGGLKTTAQQAAIEELTTAKSLYAQGLFAAAAAGKVADVDLAFLAVSQLGYTVDVDLKTKTLSIKGADGKALADKDGKTLTGAAAMGALVEALITAKPLLKGQGAGPGAVGGTTPPGGGGPNETPQQAAERIAKERAAGRPAGKFDFWGRKQPQQ
jgi:hypothetical protein